MIEEVRLFYVFMRFPIRLRLLADIGQNAAVHVEDVAVDEVGRVGREEHGRPWRSSVLPQRAAGVLEMMNWSNG